MNDTQYVRTPGTRSQNIHQSYLMLMKRQGFCKHGVFCIFAGHYVAVAVHKLAVPYP